MCFFLRSSPYNAHAMQNPSSLYLAYTLLYYDSPKQNSAVPYCALLHHANASHYLTLLRLYIAKLNFTSPSQYKSRLHFATAYHHDTKPRFTSPMHHNTPPMHHKTHPHITLPTLSFTIITLLCLYQTSPHYASA